MKRLLPSSLLGQVMLVLALGLLAAQAVSAVLLYRAVEERREAAVVNAVALRLIADNARNPADAERRAHFEAMRQHHEALAPRPFGRRMRIRIERGETSPIGAGEPRLAHYESALRDVIEVQGRTPGEIRVARRVAGEDPFVQRLSEQRPRFRQSDWQTRALIVAAVERSDGRGWVTVRVPEPPRARGRITGILLQTLVIFAVLVALLYLVLRRITRPLSRLTDRLADFSRDPGRAQVLAETGPDDARRLIAAYNAMAARIAAMLDEKDMMLGAIGHDLKTPLAALRVRIESVPDEVQRTRMAESIEDITATLDDILDLARIGKAHTTSEAVDLGALMLGIAEEFEDLGKDITIGDTPRLVAQVEVTWLKRALRNLVANAVRYAGSAELSLARDGEDALLVVEDRGPGIPEDRIAAMFEPFTRGETSRNRGTGGAGLGLTLGRAIAEQNGGSLVLENREQGGLRAVIRIPVRA